MPKSTPREQLRPFVFGVSMLVPSMLGRLGILMIYITFSSSSLIVLDALLLGSTPGISG